MSHQPERKDKDCLNCGIQVHGRFCQACGQENIVPHQDFWSLTRHFIFDIFHFDGKFFDTLKTLLLKPGQVPKEYVQGRRTRFLDPIRMYLFTSAIFFLVFFAIGDPGLLKTSADRYLTVRERLSEASFLYNRTDTTSRKKMKLLLDTSIAIKLIRTDTSPVKNLETVSIPGEGIYYLQPDINILSDTTADSWVEKKIIEKFSRESAEHGDDVGMVINDISAQFLHRIPYLLFISLPLFALILKLLYSKNRKFFYSDHAVFTLYHYIYSFIILFLLLGVISLDNLTGWGVFSWIIIGLNILWASYLLIGMKHFYAQGWGRTLIKFLILNLAGFLTLMILFLLFLVFSIIV